MSLEETVCFKTVFAQRVEEPNQNEYFQSGKFVLKRLAWFYIEGGTDVAKWQRTGLVIGRSRVRSPTGAVRECSPSEFYFVC